MESQMLSACPEHLRDELRSLFSRYPFSATPHESRGDCGGMTTRDNQNIVRIYVTPHSDCAWLLACYLHEIAHASLMCAGHPRRDDHGEDFVRICRELQVRYGVSDYAWHGYDQQDAVIKTTHEHSTLAARAAAQAVDYDPTQRAAHCAAQAVQADTRHMWRYALIVGGLSIAVMLGIAAPWAQWMDAMSAMIDRDTMTLIGGGALVGWLWFSTRG